MVEKIQYRWDFIGLSTDTKPTPETNDRVANGSTFYCSDSSKLYVWYKDQWYEKTVSGGGGGGTSNFNELSNRPKYNGVAMTGDTNIPEVVTYSNFTGTDGTAAGASGLVPAPATTDAGKFLKADGTWDTAGGGGVTVVQTTGSSTTDVMSQDATTKMIYPDIANNPHQIIIGEGFINGTNKGVAINGTIASGINGGSIAIGAPDGNYATIGGNGRANRSVAIGNTAGVGRGWESIAIGYNSYTNSGQDTGDNVAIGSSTYAGNSSATSTVALGAYAKTTRTGEVNIGTGGQNQGYNSTDYRVLGGVHDGQLAQDAVTVAQVNATIDAINTALSTNIPHIGAAS